jgi:hypothetical protein
MRQYQAFIRAYGTKAGPRVAAFALVREDHTLHTEAYVARSDDPKAIYLEAALALLTFVDLEALADRTQLQLHCPDGAVGRWLEGRAKRFEPLPLTYQLVRSIIKHHDVAVGDDPMGDHVERAIRQAVQAVIKR